jgi:hypothetical protein
MKRGLEEGVVDLRVFFPAFENGGRWWGIRRVATHEARRRSNDQNGRNHSGQ